MSSFTDNPERLTKFNPYIQQMPLEAMTNVGLQKQNQYDQGIQRIQSTIDNIAGMDIIRDVDKQYLQSKLHQLTGDLKLVAAADFSNYQLTNAVGGMVNNIGKDEKVINAVMSTKNIYRQSENIRKAKEKGEWGIENEADYLKKYNEYMSSEQVGEKFTSEYTPYTDVNKKIIDIAKSVGIDESIIPQLFETDANGNIVTNKDGTPKYNPVMAEKHLKGKDPAKLLNAFKTALTPTDMNQLAITGRYAYSGLSGEDLEKTIIKEYTGNVATITAKINDLNTTLTQEKLTDNNLEKVASLEEQITYFKNQRENLKSSTERDALTALQNPDAARASLYSNNYITGMSRSLSEISESTTYSVNPHHTIDMDLKNFQLRQQGYNLDVQKFNSSEYWKQQEFLQKERELDLKYKPTSTGSNKPPDISGMKATDLLALKSDEYSAGISELNGIDKTIAIALYKKTRDMKGKSDDEIMKAIESDAISEGYKSTDEFISKKAIDVYSTWETSDKKDNMQEFKGLMDRRRELTKDLVSRKDMMEYRHKEALRIAADEGIDVSIYGDVMSQVREMNIPLSDGSSIRLSKQDVLDFAKLNKADKNTIGEVTEDLKLRFGSNYNIIRDQLYKTRNMGYSSVTIIDPEMERISNILNAKENQRITEIEADLYKQEGNLPAGKVYHVTKGQTDNVDYTGNIVEVIQAQGGLPGLKGESTEEILRAAIDNSKAVNIDVDESATGMDYTLTVVDKDGKSYKTKITPQNYTRLTNNEPLVKATKPAIIERIDVTGSTALNKDDRTFEGAWFGEKDFQKLQGSEYGNKVRGNFVQDLSNPDNLVIELYIQGYDTPFQLPFYVSKFNAPGIYHQNLENAFAQITPADIEKLIKK